MRVLEAVDLDLEDVRGGLAASREARPRAVVDDDGQLVLGARQAHAHVRGSIDAPAGAAASSLRHAANSASLSHRHPTPPAAGGHRSGARSCIAPAQSPPRPARRARSSVASQPRRVRRVLPHRSLGEQAGEERPRSSLGAGSGAERQAVRERRRVRPVEPVRPVAEREQALLVLLQQSGRLPRSDDDQSSHAGGGPGLKERWDTSRAARPASQAWLRSSGSTARVTSRCTRASNCLPTSAANQWLWRSVSGR